MGLRTPVFVLAPPPPVGSVTLDKSLHLKKPLLHLRSEAWHLSALAEPWQRQGRCAVHEETGRAAGATASTNSSETSGSRSGASGPGSTAPDLLHTAELSVGRSDPLPLCSFNPSSYTEAIFPSCTCDRDSPFLTTLPIFPDYISGS